MSEHFAEPLEEKKDPNEHESDEGSDQEGDDEMMEDEQGEIMLDNVDSELVDEAIQQEIKDDSIAHIKAHSKDVFCIAISPDKRWVASGSEDDTAAIWDLINAEDSDTTEPLLRITSHNDSVHLLAWNSAGNILASADMIGRIVCSSLQSTTNTSLLIDDCVCTMKDDGNEGSTEQLCWLFWHPSADGILFAGCKDGSIWMWLIVRQQQDTTHLTVHQSKIFTTNSAAPCCAGHLLSERNLMAGYENSVARMWNLKDAQSTAEIALPGPCSGAIHINREANLIALGCQNGFAALINTAQNPKLLHSFRSSKEQSAENSNESGVETVRFSSNGFPWLAVGTTAGILSIFDYEKRSERYNCEHDGESVVGCIWRFGPSNSVSIISACFDSAIRVWDAKSGEPLTLMSGAGEEVFDFCIAERNDGTALVLSACANGLIRLFRLPKD